ncbi:MAG: methyltransferase domain-containing protein, partial [Candidatus Heimdallarchaeota archaeon]
MNWNYVIFLIIFFLVLLFSHQVILRIFSRYFHFPIPAFLVRFIDNPLRRRIQPPKQIIAWIDIQEGMDIIEIGPGAGTFTIEAAKAAGSKGKLDAVDIQPKVIKILEKRIEKEKISNIIAQVAAASELPFPDSSFDRVFMVGVLGETPDKVKVLLECNRVLKDDGLLAIGELLPDPDCPRRKTVLKWTNQAGFELNSKHSGFLHYL